jgi:hypothetical protein
MRRGIRHRRALVRVAMMVAVLAVLVIGVGVAMRVEALDVLWTLPRP